MVPVEANQRCPRWYREAATFPSVTHRPRDSVLTLVERPGWRLIEHANSYTQGFEQ